MMTGTIEYKGRTYEIDFSSATDLSLTLRGDEKNVRAWYVLSPRIEAVRYRKKIWDVTQGAPVNFRNISFNPHGHGTHTESVGHITRKHIPLNRCLKNFLMPALVVSVQPEKKSNGDFVITRGQIHRLIPFSAPDALIIRTLPNHQSKKHRHYSGTNPPYLHPEAAAFLRETGIEHLLIDLPSLDREEDDGLLLAHRAFWNHPEKTRTECTITELIFVPDSVPDGFYFLNLIPASFDNDAAPSRPVLYKAQPIS